MYRPVQYVLLHFSLFWSIFSERPFFNQPTIHGCSINPMLFRTMLRVLWECNIESLLSYSPTLHFYYYYILMPFLSSAYGPISKLARCTQHHTRHIWATPVRRAHQQLLWATKDVHGFIAIEPSFVMRLRNANNQATKKNFFWCQWRWWGIVWLAFFQEAWGPIVKAPDPLGWLSY